MASSSEHRHTNNARRDRVSSTAQKSEVLICSEEQLNSVLKFPRHLVSLSLVNNLTTDDRHRTQQAPLERLIHLVLIINYPESPRASRQRSKSPRRRQNSSHIFHPLQRQISDSHIILSTSSDGRSARARTVGHHHPAENPSLGRSGRVWGFYAKTSSRPSSDRSPNSHSQGSLSLFL